MIDRKKLRFETLSVHSGPGPDPATGAVVPPLHLATTYVRDEAGNPSAGFSYVRESNPTQVALEQALAPLEGGEGALVFASGMAAGVALLQALPAGSRVVMASDAYYGYPATAKEFLPRWGIEAVMIDATDANAVREALNVPTTLLHLETPSNPLMRVTDLRAILAVARDAGVTTLVDNTFATPALQRPLDLGADVVLHSTTKYFGGHSDVQGGALIFRQRGPLLDAVAHVRHLLGPVAAPFNSWLVLRGIRTLACRMAAQCATALTVAREIERHPSVERVHYPGLESDPGHMIARGQMSAFGAMLSLRIRGGREAALRAVSRCRLLVRATSLGGVETLIEHRATSEGPKSPTPQDLVRLSIGLEHADDILADLRQALDSP